MVKKSDMTWNMNIHKALFTNKSAGWAKANSFYVHVCVRAEYQPFSCMKENSPKKILIISAKNARKKEENQNRLHHAKL